MITLDQCLQLLKDAPSCQEGARKLVPKFRKMPATDVAQLLHELVKAGWEVSVAECLQLLDNMPMEYFDTLMDIPEVAEWY